jgi:hypothetical protein
VRLTERGQTIVANALTERGHFVIKKITERGQIIFGKNVGVSGSVSIPTRQIISETSSALIPTSQRLYKVSTNNYKTVQSIYKIGLIAIPIKLKTYYKSRFELSIYICVFSTNAITIPTRQILFEEEQLIGIVNLSGQQILNVSLNGYSELNVTLRGEL